MYIPIPRIPPFHDLILDGLVTAINIKAEDFVAAVLCVLLVLVVAGFHHAVIRRAYSGRS